MSSISLFREPRMPSARDERLAHERFLLDTYADRREAEPDTKPTLAILRALRAMGRRRQ